MKKTLDKRGNVWYYSEALSKTALLSGLKEAHEKNFEKSSKKVKKVLDKGEWLCYNSLRRFGKRSSQADLEN
ncbi:MAG: hypothetical protein IKT68_03060 [Clostridia bacterium]|nr:hypothetical protein [Clostridia bacterium]